MKSLKQKTIENIGHNSIAKVVALVVQAAANIVLTRLLLPADYGIVGFATVFISFLNQFNDMGVNAAVVRRKTLTDDQLYTGFTLKCVMGLTLFIITMLIAPLAKNYFDNPVIVDVIRVCALQYIIGFFKFIPSIILTRELNFKNISRIEMISGIATSMIAVSLAYCGFKFWSLVIGNLFTLIMNVVMMNILKPKKVKLVLDRVVAKEFLRFGSNMFLTGLIAFAILNVNNFVIGTVKGSTALGYYSLAWTWGSMFFTLMGGIVMSVLVPTFAKIQEDHKKMKAVFLQGLCYIALGAALVNTVLIVACNEFLISVLGRGTEKWLPAAACFQIICVLGIIRSMIHMVGPVFQALGNSRIFLVSDAFVAIIQMPLLYPALRYFDIEGMALLLLIVTFIQLPIYIPALRRDIDVHWIEIVAVIWPALTSSVMVYMILMFMPNPFGATFSGFAYKAILATAIFVTSHTVLTKGRLLRELREMLPFESKQLT